MEETRAGRRHQHASHRHRFCHMPIAPGFLLFSSPAPAPARPSGASATGTVPGCGAALTFSPARPPGFFVRSRCTTESGPALPGRNERTNHAEKLPARACVGLWWRVFLHVRTVREDFLPLCCPWPWVVRGAVVPRLACPQSSSLCHVRACAVKKVGGLLA